MLLLQRYSIAAFLNVVWEIFYNNPLHGRIPNILENQQKLLEKSSVCLVNNLKRLQITLFLPFLAMG
jgi:hypothetical protein